MAKSHRSDQGVPKGSPVCYLCRHLVLQVEVAGASEEVLVLVGEESQDIARQAQPGHRIVPTDFGREGTAVFVAVHRVPERLDKVDHNVAAAVALLVLEVVHNQGDI